MDYRLWALMGIALLIAELFTPSFFLVFFGAGALLAALTTGLGWTEGQSGQLAVFIVSSLVLMALFREKIRLRAAPPVLPPDYLHQRVKVTKAISPGEEGQVSYRGSMWIAFSDEAVAIPEGSMVEIIGIDGVRLKVKQTA